MGLIHAIDAGPREGASYNNRPECVSLQRVRIKAKWKQTENKFELSVNYYRSLSRVFWKQAMYTYININKYIYIYTQICTDWLSNVKGRNISNLSSVK